MHLLEGGADGLVGIMGQRKISLQLGDADFRHGIAQFAHKLESELLEKVSTVAVGAKAYLGWVHGHADHLDILGQLLAELGDIANDGVVACESAHGPPLWKRRTFGELGPEEDDGQLLGGVVYGLALDVLQPSHRRCGLWHKRSFLSIKTFPRAASSSYVRFCAGGL